MPVMPEVTELTPRPFLFVANITMALIARGLDGKQSELGALRLVFPAGNHHVSYLAFVAPGTEKSTKATVTCRGEMPEMPEMTELTSRPTLFVANVIMILIARGLKG